MVKIVKVDPNSRAEHAGIVDGDILVSINGRAISDVVDYRFFLAEKSILLKLSRSGEEFEVTIKKQQYDDIGLDFETPLMDKKHSCENKCVFFEKPNARDLLKCLKFMKYKNSSGNMTVMHGSDTFRSVLCPCGRKLWR